MPRSVVRTRINGKIVELGLNDGKNDGKSDGKNDGGNTDYREKKIEVLGVADELSTPEEIDAIHNKVDKVECKIPENVDIIDYIGDLQDKSEGKDWWESKTIWINVSILITIIFSLFGLNIYVDPEVLLIIASIFGPLINLWLRNKTEKPLKNKKKK